VTAAGPVVAVFGHPDDAEISAGATLAKWCAAGRQVHLLVLTNGDRGSDDAATDRAELARTRARETESAAKVLGLASTAIMDVHDGELENTAEVRERVVRTIREVRPSTLVSCDPTAWFFENRYYNHADHRTAGAVALDAVFPGSGNPLFFPEQLAEGLEAHPVTDVWLGWTLEPNHHEDVTGFLQTKLAALAEHVSQLEADLLGYFEQWIPKEAEEAGRQIGVRHAESFRRLDLS
jgi:LmbE family N-acetylglucosaminyl deacetylase